MSATKQVVVQGIDRLASDVLAFDLASVDGGVLPPFTAGAHIDIQLPTGLRRQYSLCNSPSRSHVYRIAVKREERSRGGSAHLHDRVKPGDCLTIGTPRNNFALNDRAASHLLLAGGIGVTPMVSMAAHLPERGASFRMEYFVRSSEYEAFGTPLRQPAYADRVRIHQGMTGIEVEGHMQQLLRDRPTDTDVYVCGPEGFLKAAKDASRHWPSGSVHTEAFGGRVTLPESSDQAFEVVLARSGKRVPVPAGKSIFVALQEAGTELEVSCQQGACGVCALRVLEGSPDHRDSFLSDEERSACTKVMPCVSRSKSPCLVLDI